MAMAAVSARARPRADAEIGLHGMAHPTPHTHADAENDVEMLTLAGIGAAVANARPDALAAADVMVASNADDGVADAVRRFVLGAGDDVSSSEEDSDDVSSGEGGSNDVSSGEGGSNGISSGEGGSGEGGSGTRVSCADIA